MTQIKFPKDGEYSYDPVEVLLIDKNTALFLGYKVETGGDMYQDVWFYFNPITGEKIE